MNETSDVRQENGLELTNSRVDPELQFGVGEQPRVNVVNFVYSSLKLRQNKL
jgi:hypothetical protein